MDKRTHLGQTLSPDGMQFAIGGDSGAVQLRDTMTGSTVHAWSAHPGNVMDIAFSPATSP
jgi:WD40 repeat protein